MSPTGHDVGFVILAEFEVPQTIHRASWSGMLTQSTTLMASKVKEPPLSADSYYQNFGRASELWLTISYLWCHGAERSSTVL